MIDHIFLPTELMPHVKRAFHLIMARRWRLRTTTRWWSTSCCRIDKMKRLASNI